MLLVKAKETRCHKEAKSLKDRIKGVCVTTVFGRIESVDTKCEECVSNDE